MQPLGEGPTGLTTSEAGEQRARYGLNRLPERRHHPIVRFLRKLWAPVPWMLELSLVLELALHHGTQAVIILVLLLLNATVGFVEERRARSALELLRSRLSVKTRVLRDGRWGTLAAEQIVPNDVIHVRMGDIVPADVEVFEGSIQADQSMLTGESEPVTVDAGRRAFSGSVVVRGEATARVTATGGATEFGRTAELVRSARSTGHLQSVILRIVRSLAIIDVGLVAIVLVRAVPAHTPPSRIVPFALMLLVASVPVALSATFTVASAVGARALAQAGVLVTRLSAITEAASVDILCSDKTGTLTENRLKLTALRPAERSSEADLLLFASLASEPETQDPIDLAILAAATERGIRQTGYAREDVVPFDPATKRSEVTVADPQGMRIRVVKGAPHVIAAMLEASASVVEQAEQLGKEGERVLAVAADRGSGWHLMGLLGFLDAPRKGVREAIGTLRELGVRTVMVTGDNPATAQAVARRIGIQERSCPREALGAGRMEAINESTIFANVLPEDKFRLVTLLQRAGHVVGMTGDGVNDAPALKQAEVGVALANATDVAKAAASVVLTRPGIDDVAQAVRIGREVYQRLLTYTLNKVIKTFHVTLFLSGGFLLWRTFVVTPRHVVLLLLANDFVTMSLASDHVVPSLLPDRWDVRALTRHAFALSLGWVAFSLLVFALGRRLPEAELQTLNFLGLAFSGQATVYIVRERRHFFRSMPGRWLMVASLAVIVMLVLMARFGVLIAPAPLLLVGAVLAGVVITALLLDLIKVRLLGVPRHPGLGR